MGIFKTELEKRIGRKFAEIEDKIKNSFRTIRGEMKLTADSLEVIKKHIKNYEKQYEYSKKKDAKLRTEFRRDVDEFTQKTKELKLAFKRVEQIEKELVLRSDLARIEENIRGSFREEIDSFVEQEKEFKKHINKFNKRLNRIEKLHNGVLPCSDEERSFSVVGYLKSLFKKRSS